MKGRGKERRGVIILNISCLIQFFRGEERRGKGSKVLQSILVPFNNEGFGGERRRFYYFKCIFT